MPFPDVERGEHGVMYVHLRRGIVVARTIAVSPSVNVDLNDNDRVTGIEVLDGTDWAAALVKLAIAGRLAVVERCDLE